MKHYNRESAVFPLFLDDSFSVGFIDKDFCAKLFYIGKYSDPRKRVSKIIDYLKIARNKIKFNLLGHISDDFKSHLKLVDNKNVSYNAIGVVDFDKKIDYFIQTNFLFFPTELEGFGLPILEAMRTSIVPIVFGDAIIPDCLKSRCKIIDKVEEIDDIIDEFKNDREKYRDFIESNHRYSLQFNDKKLLDFLRNISDKY